MPIQSAATIGVSIQYDATAAQRQFAAVISRAQTFANNNPLKIKADLRPLGQISGNVKEFEKSLQAATARIVAFTGVTTLIYGVSTAFSQLVKNTIDVEKRFKDIQVIAGSSSATFKQFQSDIFEAAKNTGQSFDTASKAALEFARQGIKLTEVSKAVNAALLLSRSSGIDAADAANQLTGAVNVFNKQALTRIQIVNKLANVDSNFSVSQKDLADAISRAGSSAQDAGVDFDKLISLTTTLQQTTQRGGAVIGNALKSIFTRLQRGSTIDALESFNVQVKDAQGNALAADDILKNLARTLKTLNSRDAAALTEKVAGGFQINQLKALLGDLSQANSVYSQALNTSRNSTDEAIRRNEELNKTIAASFEKAKTNFVELSSAIGNFTIAPVAKNILGKFNGIADLLKNFGESDSAGAKIGKGLLDGIGKAISGPGLSVIGLLLLKSFGSLAKFARDAAGGFISTNKASREQISLQEGINALLSSGNGEYLKRIASAKGEVSQQQELLAIIKERSALESLSNSRFSGLAASAYKGGARFNADTGGFSIPRKAEGHIPALIEEKIAVNNGVGGATSAAEPKLIPNFNFGGGRRGAVVANTHEYIVPNFGGGDGSAIFNPEMVRKYGLPRGAQKINAAGGLIPNFISNKDLFKPKISRGKLGINFENDFGSALLHIHGKTAKIGGIDTVAQGQGFSKFVYEDIFKYLKEKKVTQVRGDILQQPLKATGIDSVSKVKAALPQLIRGRLGRNSVLGIGSEEFHLAGGDKFDESLAGQAGDIFEALKRSNGIPSYTTNLAGGLVPSLTKLFGGKQPREIRGILEELGYKANKGSSRAFYPINNQLGVKVPFNEAGLAQQEKESGILSNDDYARQQYNKFLPKEFAHDKDNFSYSIVENLKNATSKDYQKNFGVDKSEFRGLLGASSGPNTTVDGKEIYPKGRKYKNNFQQLDNFLQDYDIHESDIGRSNVGVDRKGKLKLRDIGFDNNIAAKFYGRNRNLGRAVATGFIPSFANPLLSAISREHSAGIPLNSIRIEKSQQLISSQNPLGIGVTNTRDEPNGITQGISRARSYGIDPKTHGAAKGIVPNFAIESTGANLDKLLKALKQQSDPIKERARIQRLEGLLKNLSNLDFNGINSKSTNVDIFGKAAPQLRDSLLQKFGVAGNVESLGKTKGLGSAKAQKAVDGITDIVDKYLVKIQKDLKEAVRSSSATKQSFLNKKIEDATQETNKIADFDKEQGRAQKITQGFAGRVQNGTFNKVNRKRFAQIQSDAVIREYANKLGVTVDELKATAGGQTFIKNQQAKSSGEAATAFNNSQKNRTRIDTNSAINEFTNAQKNKFSGFGGAFVAERTNAGLDKFLKTAAGKNLNKEQIEGLKDFSTSLKAQRSQQRAQVGFAASFALPIITSTALSLLPKATLEQQKSSERKSAVLGGFSTGLSIASLGGFSAPALLGGAALGGLQAVRGYNQNNRTTADDYSAAYQEKSGKSEENKNAAFSALNLQSQLKDAIDNGAGRQQINQISEDLRKALGSIENSGLRKTVSSSKPIEEIAGDLSKQVAELNRQDASGDVRKVLAEITQSRDDFFGNEATKNYSLDDKEKDRLGSSLGKTFDISVDKNIPDQAQITGLKKLLDQTSVTVGDIGQVLKQNVDLDTESSARLNSAKGTEITEILKAQIARKLENAQILQDINLQKSSQLNFKNLNKSIKDIQNNFSIAGRIGNIRSQGERNRQLEVAGTSLNAVGQFLNPKTNLDLQNGLIFGKIENDLKTGLEEIASQSRSTLAQTQETIVSALSEPGEDGKDSDSKEKNRFLQLFQNLTLKSFSKSNYGDDVAGLNDLNAGLDDLKKQLEKEKGNDKQIATLTDAENQSKVAALELIEQTKQQVLTAKALIQINQSQLKFQQQAAVLGGGGENTRNFDISSIQEGLGISAARRNKQIERPIYQSRGNSFDDFFRGPLRNTSVERDVRGGNQLREATAAKDLAIGVFGGADKDLNEIAKSKFVEANRTNTEIQLRKVLREYRISEGDNGPTVQKILAKLQPDALDQTARAQATNQIQSDNLLPDILQEFKRAASVYQELTSKGIPLDTKNSGNFATLIKQAEDLGLTFNTVGKQVEDLFTRSNLRYNVATSSDYGKDISTQLTQQSKAVNGKQVELEKFNDNILQNLNNPQDKNGPQLSDFVRDGNNISNFDFKNTKITDAKTKKIIQERVTSGLDNKNLGSQLLGLTKDLKIDPKDIQDFIKNLLKDFVANTSQQSSYVNPLTGLTREAPPNQEKNINDISQNFGALSQNDEALENIKVQQDLLKANADKVAGFTEQINNIGPATENANTEITKLIDQIKQIQVATGVKTNVDPQPLPSQKFANGYIPNYANGIHDAFSRERDAIAKGVGGAKIGDYPIVKNIRGLGTAVVNSGEFIGELHNGKEAVLNRNMMKNFAEGVFENKDVALRKKLKKEIDASIVRATLSKDKPNISDDDVVIKKYLSRLSSVPFSPLRVNRNAGVSQYNNVEKGLNPLSVIGGNYNTTTKTADFIADNRLNFKNQLSKNRKSYDQDARSRIFGESNSKDLETFKNFTQTGGIRAKLDNNYQSPLGGNGGLRNVSVQHSSGVQGPRIEPNNDEEIRRIQKSQSRRPAPPTQEDKNRNRLNKEGSAGEDAFVLNGGQRPQSLGGSIGPTQTKEAAAKNPQQNSQQSPNTNIKIDQNINVAITGTVKTSTEDSKKIVDEEFAAAQARIVERLEALEKKTGTVVVPRAGTISKS